MVIPLSQLAAFVTPAPDRSILSRSMAGIADTLSRTHDRDEEIRQANLRMQLGQEQIAEQRRAAMATNAENIRSAMAVEEQARQNAAALKAKQQAEFMGRMQQAAAQGAPPEVIRQMAIEGSRMGVGINEQMTPGSPGAPAEAPHQIPRQLAAFSPMMGGPIMSEGKPAVEAVAPAATGVFDVTAGGSPMGQVNVPQVQGEQREQRRPIAAATMGLGSGIDRAQYQKIGQGILETPGLTPADAQKSASSAAIQAAGDLNANVRAAQARASQGDRGAGIQTRLQDKMVNDAQNGILQTALQSEQVKTIKQRINSANRFGELVKQSQGMAETDDPNALSGRVAVGELVKSIYGAQSSNQELRTIQASGGAWAQFETFVNQWMGGGEISATQMQMMMQVGQLSQRVAQEQLGRVALDAENAARSEILTRQYRPDLVEQYAQQAGRRIVGGTADPSTLPRGNAGAGGGSGQSSSVSLSGPPAAAATGMIPDLTSTTGDVTDEDEARELLGL